MIKDILRVEAEIVEKRVACAREICKEKKIDDSKLSDTDLMGLYACWSIQANLHEGRER